MHAGRLAGANILGEGARPAAARIRLAHRAHWDIFDKRCSISPEHAVGVKAK